MNGAKVLVLGVAYKQDIDDYREGVLLLELLNTYLKKVRMLVILTLGLKKFQEGDGMHSIKELTDTVLKNADLVVITTAHTNIDYDFVQNMLHLFLILKMP